MSKVTKHGGTKLSIKTYSWRQAYDDIDSVTFSKNKMRDARAKAYYKSMKSIAGPELLYKYLENGGKRLLKESDQMLSDKLVRSPKEKAKSIGSQLVRLNPDDPNDHRLVSKKMSGHIREKTIEQYEEFSREDSRTYAQQARDNNLNKYYGYDVWDLLKAEGVYDKKGQYNISEGWYEKNGQRYYFDEMNINKQ